MYSQTVRLESGRNYLVWAAFNKTNVTIQLPAKRQVLMGRRRCQRDVNMANCRVENLYKLAAFTTARNCDLYKCEFRSLPNTVQCDIYRQVSVFLLLSPVFVEQEIWKDKQDDFPLTLFSCMKQERQKSWWRNWVNWT